MTGGWFRLRAGWMLAAALGVSACSTGESPVDKALPFLSSGPSAPQVVSRAQYQRLVEAGQPQMLAVVESREFSAPLVLLHRANGVEVWVSADGASVSLRDGVVVATRGLAPDLMSADASQTARLLAARQEGEAELFQTHLDGEDRLRTSAYVCDLHDIQPFDLDLGTRVVPTRYMVQACHGMREDFLNYFWVDTRTGDIRQSRQVIHPELGLLALRQVLP